MSEIPTNEPRDRTGGLRNSLYLFALLFIAPSMAGAMVRWFLDAMRGDIDAINMSISLAAIGVGWALAWHAKRGAA